MFVDIHAIQSVPPSNLNRDDSGSPKTFVYGGVRRSTVSSQSWKRAMRETFARDFDKNFLSVRTVGLVQAICEKLMELDPSVTKSEAILRVCGAIGGTGVGVDKIKLTKKDNPDDLDYPVGKALIFVSNTTIDNVAQYVLDNDAPMSKKQVVEYFNDKKAVEINLFGRMVAGNSDLKIDACSQVAFALGVNTAVITEDFYTALDDLAIGAEDRDAGAIMLGHNALVSSTFYRYMNIDATELNNRYNDKEVVARIVRSAVEGFVTSMPTGKQNSYANRTRPNFIMVDIRDDQPVNFAGAFEAPIDTNITNNAVSKLFDYAESENKTYGTEPAARFMIDVTGLVGGDMTLDELLVGVEDYVAKNV